MPHESIVRDVSINNRKWAIVGVYRPPSMDNKIFTDLFTRGMDLISTKFDSVLTLGNLNYDCLDRTRGSTLLDLCDIFDFKNIIKTATYFMKNCQPSLVDVILTNQSRLCFGALNFWWGISNWYNMIGVAVRGVSVREQKQILNTAVLKILIKMNLMKMSVRYLSMRPMFLMISMTFTGRMKGYSPT